MRPAWLQALLSDGGVLDICINGPDAIFVDRGDGLEKNDARFPSAIELRDWILSELSLAGRSWDAKHPFVDATLDDLGAPTHRLHVTFPPVARSGLLISLRRLARSPDRSNAHARKLAEDRWGSSPLFSLLADSVRRGDPMILCGATGSGKTTLLNDLLSHVPEAERIVALEDTAELEPALPHFISLVSRPPNSDGCGEVTLRTLLKQTLRMRPDRILLGECRGAEVLDLLQALNTGHRGAMATLHASSPRDALRRLELLCLLAGGSSIPLGAIRDLIAAGVHWIVFVKKRVIFEVARIEGREGDTILLRPLLKVEGWPPDRRDARSTSSG